jgi:hypothetical protein
MRWTHDNGRTVAGRFIELVPSRRLVFAYGWEDGWLGVAAGSTRVVVELSPAAGGSGTRLRLTHHGLEGEAADQHQRGWAHFLARLSANAARRAVTNPSSNPSSRTVTNPSSRTSIVEPDQSSGTPPPAGEERSSA